MQELEAVLEEYDAAYISEYGHPSISWYSEDEYRNFIIKQIEKVYELSIPLRMEIVYKDY